MMRTASSPFLKVSLCTLVVLCFLAFWLNYTIRHVPIPRHERLADIKTNTFSLTLLVHYHEPYHFVLGLPHNSPTPNFRGELVVSQPTGIVVRLPLTSDDIKSCNWLNHRYGLAGYILAASHTNHSERLSQILAKGQNYELQITFSQLPPRESSLWFSSIRLNGEPDFPRPPKVP